MADKSLSDIQSPHGSPVPKAWAAAMVHLHGAQIARDALGSDDPDGAAVVEDIPLKPNPVTQDEMDAGSVELF